MKCELEKGYFAYQVSLSFSKRVIMGDNGVEIKQDPEPFYDDEADERRREYAIRRLMGQGASKANERILEKDKYDITPQGLRNDWHNRSEWLPRIFGFENAELSLQEILAEKKVIKREMWKVFSEASSDREKRLILRDLDDMNDSILETFQSLGLIHKEPDRVDVDLSTVTDESAEVIDSVLTEIEEETEEEDPKKVEG